MHNHAPFDPDKHTNEPQLNQLWNNISHELRGSLGESAYDIWFSDFRLGSVSPEEIVMIAPGTMYAIWVEENFKNSLSSAFTKFLGACGRIRFEVNEAASSVFRAETDAAEGNGAGEIPARVVPRILVEKVSEQKLLERGRAFGWNKGGGPPDHPRVAAPCREGVCEILFTGWLWNGSPGGKPGR